MKATELRIGNWFSQYGVNYQCSASDIESIANPSIAFECEPIPLTEEWLESTNIDGTSFGVEPCFTIWTEGNKVYLEQYGEGRVWLDHIEYRHQAQNLYFALTGEELQTDETDQKVNQ